MLNQDQISQDHMMERFQEMCEISAQSVAAERFQNL